MEVGVIRIRVSGPKPPPFDSRINVLFCGFDLVTKACRKFFGLVYMGFCVSFMLGCSVLSLGSGNFLLQFHCYIFQLLLPCTFVSLVCISEFLELLFMIIDLFPYGVSECQHCPSLLQFICFYFIYLFKSFIWLLKFFESRFLQSFLLLLF